MARFGSGRAMGQLAGMSMQRWAAAVGVLVLGVSGLFGGLNEAPPKPPTAVNTEVDGGAWKVTVTGAYVTSEFPKGMYLTKGSKAIVVTATVELTNDETWTLLPHIVQMAPTDGVKDRLDKLGYSNLEVHRTQNVMLVRDGVRTGMLHPNMPEKLAFFFELAETKPVPAEIKVYLLAWVLRADNITNHVAWFPEFGDSVSVAVPVTRAGAPS